MDTSKATARPWVIHQSSRYRGDINMAWDIATEAATWDAKDYDEDEDAMGAWQFPADYRRIATTSDMGPEAKANAALIVRAVNSHEALVAALRSIPPSPVSRPVTSAEWEVADRFEGFFDAFEGTAVRSIRSAAYERGMADGKQARAALALAEQGGE